MGVKVRKCCLFVREVSTWFLGAIAVLSANLAADALLKTFNTWSEGTRGAPYYQGAAEIAFFLFMVCILYTQREKFFAPRTRFFSDKTPEQRKHLVIFLSSLSKNLETTEGIPEGLTITGDMVKDIDALVKLKTHQSNWSWEMPLRAIMHHTEPTRIGPLRTVTIICSKESIHQASFFYKICRQYDRLEGVVFQILCKKNQKLQLEPLRGIDTTSAQGFDFESFDELSEGMGFLLRKFRRRGIRGSEIMIDITGGQKPTSVIGAAMTFNQEINAQYIQTNHPWNVKSYDVILVSPSTGKLTI